MKKLFQTGLALGNISGNCSACNIDLSWLYHTPSKLLWLDKIVVTDYLWNLLVSPPRTVYKEDHDINTYQRDLMQKTGKLVFELLDSVGLIEHISDNFVSDDNYEAINKQIDSDFDLLLELGKVKTEDSHRYSIGECQYCKPRLWTLYFSLLAAICAAVKLTFAFSTVTIHVVLTFVDTFPFIVIVAVPVATPVTVPSSATVAIFVAPDVYFKSSTTPLGVVVT